MGRQLDNRREGSNNHQRTLLAQEAARLICDHGITNFGAAKSKAAMILGLRSKGALPSNQEIEAAVAERNRIFKASEHPQLLLRIRRAAVEAMYELQDFAPFLVGPVLSGNITEYSTIHIHIFSDTAELVGMRLTENSIAHQLTQKKLRLQRDHSEEFPGYEFMSGEFGVEATVFPERRKSHAPLSSINGKPMRRARLREVERLTEPQLTTV